MISFTSRQKYYFYSGPMDMRKDIDTLSEVVRSQMGLDPYIEESVFIFMSRGCVISLWRTLFYVIYCIILEVS